MTTRAEEAESVVAEAEVAETCTRVFLGVDAVPQPLRELSIGPQVFLLCRGCADCALSAPGLAVAARPCPLRAFACQAPDLPPQALAFGEHIFAPRIAGAHEILPLDSPARTRLVARCLRFLCFPSFFFLLCVVCPASRLRSVNLSSLVTTLCL